VLTIKKVSPLGFIVLAIIVAEILVFMPSSTEEMLTQGFVAPSPEANLSIQGFHAVHLNQQGQKETINAKEAELFKKDGYAILKDVNIRIFTKGGEHTIFITGAKGKYYMEQKNLELFDNIVVVSENLGYEMRTEYLKYEQAKNLLWTDKEISIIGPNPQRPSLEFTSKGLSANTKTEEFKLLSDVHCIKYDENAESIEIDSETGIAYLDKSQILFSGNVVVKQKKMNIFTDNFLITYNRENQSIDRAKAYDLVKIVEGDRVATCKTAYLLNREKKIVMRGSPKVVQGNDVVEGKIIIFYTAENKILFDEAVGEFSLDEGNKLE